VRSLARLFGIFVSASQLVLWGTATGETYILPEIDATFGYESNRYRTEDGSSSPFLAITPACALTSFISDETELNGFVSYQKREYLESGFSHTGTMRIMGELRRMGGAWERGLSIAGFGFNDAEFSSDDMTRLSVIPSLVYTDFRGKRFSLVGSVGRYHYAARETSDGNDMRGTFWALRPGLRLPLSRRSTLWTEVIGNVVLSNEETEEYSGLSVTLGLDYTPPTTHSAGFSIQFSARNYHDPLNASTGNKSEAFWGKAWYLLRMAPWAEFHGEAGGGSSWIESSSYDYERYYVLLGFRLTREIEIGSASF
jgi:hypothetical protein